MKSNQHKQRFIAKLNEASRETLIQMWRNHPQFRARNRAQMILLSDKGMTREQIAQIGMIDVDTVSRTFNRWEQWGLVGLLDAPKSGRPPKMSQAEQARAKDLINQTPHNPTQAYAKLTLEAGSGIHPKTFRRFLKKSGFVWKRMRRSLKAKRNEADFAQAQSEIASFHQREERGEVDVFYFDESGFAFDSAIPYGWQPRGAQVLLPASKGKRVNVLGFCNRFNQFMSHVVVGKVDSNCVIDCFDQFVTKMTRPTVVILDNARIHRSSAFKKKMSQWASAGLTVYFLPPYSPELNLIEIVWRFIKYQWMPLSAFTDMVSFSTSLDHILANIGTDEYRISFV